MLRLKHSEMLGLDLDKQSGLALPEATPQTLIEVDSESLPYACQCPLCGGLFKIPEGLLYRIEDDDYADTDSDTEVKGLGNSDYAPNEASFESTAAITSTGSTESGGGGLNDSAL